MSYEIIVKHSKIEVHNYELGDAPRIEKSLSIWQYEYIGIGFAYDPNTKILYLPRGLDVPFLERELKATARYDTKHDPYDKVEFYMKNPPRDEMQKKIIAYLSGKREFEYTYKRSQLMVDLMTGKGKTYCTLAAISLFKVRSAIFCFDEEKIKEWRDDILEHTHIEEDEIYIIKGKKSIEKLVNGKLDKLPKVYLISHRTLGTYCKENPLKLTELFKILRIGIKVFDEAHKEFYLMIKTDLFSNTQRTYYLSASPDRSNHKESSVYQLYFKNVLSYGNDELITENDIYAYGLLLHMDTRPTMQDVLDCQTKHGFSATAYSDQLVKGRSRAPLMKAMEQAIKVASCNTDMRIAIYMTSIASLNTMKEWLIEDLAIPEEEIGIFHSKVPAKEKEHAKNRATYVLTTIKSLGTGKNIPGLTTIIDTEAFSSANTARQLPGRLREIKGKKLFYIKLVNDGYKKFVSQVKSVKPTWKKVLKHIYVMK